MTPPEESRQSSTSRHRVLVTGGRDYADYAAVEAALAEFDLDHYIELPVLVHGAARGADSLAAQAAEFLGMPIEAHPANWRKYGKAAGAIRNQEMLDTGVDIVLAFPGGTGTADMIRRARKAGVEVREVG